MPGKRAADVRLRNVGISDNLWTEVKTKAARDGVSVSEVIRRKLREYVNDD